MRNVAKLAGRSRGKGKREIMPRRGKGRGNSYLCTEESTVGREERANSEKAAQNQSGTQEETRVRGERPGSLSSISRKVKKEIESSNQEGKRGGRRRLDLENVKREKAHRVRSWRKKGEGFWGEKGRKPFPEAVSARGLKGVKRQSRRGATGAGRRPVSWVCYN